MYTYGLIPLCAAYQVVVKIPQGAVHIKVQEKVISRNYLGKETHLVHLLKNVFTL